MPAVEINLYRHGHTATEEDPNTSEEPGLAVPLDALGLRQASQLGSYQLENHLVPGMVYSSHAERALATAHIASRMALKGAVEPKVVPDWQLVEQNLGIYEARQSAARLLNAIERIMAGEIDIRDGSHETLFDVGARVYGALERGARLAAVISVKQVDFYTHNIAIACGWRELKVQNLCAR